MKLGLSLFTVLTAIAAVHVYWAFGGLWPATSEPELVRMVVGMANGQQMPALSGTLMVAFLVFAGGVVALVRSMSLPRLMAWIPLIGSIVLAAVFLGRGAFTYAVAAGLADWPYPLAAPFQTLDQMLYAPLCLAIGTGFSILVLKGGGKDA